MIKLRGPVFETNSSSTHTLVIDENFKKSDKSDYLNGVDYFIDDEKLIVLIDWDYNEYGVKSSFIDKLNYIVAIMLNENAKCTSWNKDGDMTYKGAYKALRADGGEFEKKICEWLTEHGHKCTGIQIGNKPEENAIRTKRGGISFMLDHGVLEEGLSAFDKSPFDIIIDESVSIDYDWY